MPPGARLLIKKDKTLPAKPKAAAAARKRKETRAISAKVTKEVTKNVTPKPQVVDSPGLIEWRELSEDAKIERVKSVLESIATPMTLTKALQKHGVSPHGFYRVVQSSPEMVASFNRAREISVHQMAAQVIDIADDSDDPIKARNRIDARKWLASKLRPQEYGDKIEINANINNRLDTAAILAAARKRRDEAIEGECSRVDESE